MQKSLTHPIVGEVIISSTRRSTRISLSVRPNGKVRLSFPPYVSQSRALEFLKQKIDWVVAAQKRYAERAIAPTLSKVEIEDLRKEAKAILPNRVAELAAKHSLHYGRITIRATRSKWGSCSATGNISLSLYLMQLPEHLRDYVIIHELCHTVHHNHSPLFHALVNQLTMGQEKALARELRNYTIA